MAYLFEIVSLWWTFPAIAISLLLLRRYGPRAIITIKRIFRGEWSDIPPSSWINLGIAVCFFGSIVDNAYWLIPWSIKYATFDHSFLFDFGVYINVPFRQVPLILGAILHVFAEALKHREPAQKEKRMKALVRTFWISAIIGAIYVLILTIYRVMFS